MADFKFIHAIYAHVLTCSNPGQTLAKAVLASSHSLSYTC